MRFRITILKGEQIIECKIFDKRDEATQFIEEFKAEPKPYKPIKNKVYHTMEGLQ